MSPETEPGRLTDPALSSVLAELIQREPIFHRPEFGTTRADYERMTAEDFWEVGASGRRYGRAYVLDVLEQRATAPVEEELEASDFCCRRLAGEVYLLTYTLVQNRTRKTRRSTIWQRTASGWQIVFHQGTIIVEP
jgi:hypothetical protein